MKELHPCIWCKEPKPDSEMIVVVHQHPPSLGGHKAFEHLCYPCSVELFGKEHADERFEQRKRYNDPPPTHGQN